MEVKPTIERYRKGYRCFCDRTCGTGRTPGEAYARWIKRFEYAATINSVDGMINSMNVKMEGHEHGWDD